MKELTFSIIKPDSITRSGEILALIQKNNFKIVAQRMILITKNQAENFYGIHKDRPFFNDLVNFMISGPVIIMTLEKENAVHDLRNLMGATNPSDAKEGTIRKLFGANIEKNAIHGSDSKENAQIEISFFFSKSELFI
jgi:nucleoside-diphosphate kinase